MIPLWTMLGMKGAVGGHADHLPFASLHPEASFALSAFLASKHCPTKPSLSAGLPWGWLTEALLGTKSIYDAPAPAPFLLGRPCQQRSSWARHLSVGLSSSLFCSCFLNNPSTIFTSGKFCERAASSLPKA